MENGKLETELETQKLNLRDINEFLTNELKARSLTTSAMEAKVVELYHLLDDVNKSHEVRDRVGASETLHDSRFVMHEMER